jgi:hypothetical protein
MLSAARRGRPSLTAGWLGAFGWRGCSVEGWSGEGRSLGDTREDGVLLGVVVGSPAVVSVASVGFGALAGCPVQATSDVAPTTASTAMR